jgi:TRAP-type mannitol/chloroaromatic compound transport system permease large subunit
MGVEPIWLGVMKGVLLQNSFLTPPIYLGVLPFIGL